MRLYAICVYLFLYIPIGIIALFSFNAGRHASQFSGFSTQWYGKALNNPFVMDALETSLIAAFLTACLASVLGTMAAIALQGVTGWLRTLFDALIYIDIPGIDIIPGYRRRGVPDPKLITDDQIPDGRDNALRNAVGKPLSEFGIAEHLRDLTLQPQKGVLERHMPIAQFRHREPLIYID